MNSGYLVALLAVTMALALNFRSDLDTARSSHVRPLFRAVARVRIAFGASFVVLGWLALITSSTALWVVAVVLGVPVLIAAITWLLAVAVGPSRT